MANAIMVHDQDVQTLKTMITKTVKVQLNHLFESIKREKNRTLLTRKETFCLLKTNSTKLWSWTREVKLKCYALGNIRYYKKSQVSECSTLLNK